MKRAAIGFRAHTGWAAAVTIAGTAKSPAVVDRRRVDLLGSGVPWEVYHAASLQPTQKAKALVERAANSARSMAAQALDTMIEELGSAGYQVRSAGVVLGGRLATLPLEQALRGHAAKHAAEGQLYRAALLGAAGDRGLQVLGIAEKELEEYAASAFGMATHELRQRLADMGKAMGAPWSCDQRRSVLIAWLALVPKKGSQR